MAILLGAGTFRLSRAIARCGYLVGFMALLFFSLMHIFICLRLVEVPRLIQQDVPSAAFLASLFLPTSVYSLFATLSVLSWFGHCFIQLQHVIQNVLTVVALDVAQSMEQQERMPFGWKLLGTLLLALAVVPVSLKTSAKEGNGDESCWNSF